MKKGILLAFILSAGLVHGQDIFSAARSGNAAEVSTLYDFNADTINAVNEQGYSPLILACYYNQVEVIQLLMTYEVELKEEPGTPTALQAACYKGFAVAAGLLLDYGANPNIADANGTSPLIYAAQFNHTAIVQLLVDHKVDRTYQDPRGLTARDYADKLGYTDVVDILDSVD